MELREKAISVTLNNIYTIFECLLKNPEVYDVRIKDIVLNESISKAPRYHLDLIITLSKLYDAGYDNAWKDREKIKQYPFVACALPPVRAS